LVNSIRRYDTDTPIMMIPHSSRWQHAARTLSQQLGVLIYDDLAALRRFDRKIRLLFGQGFFPNPGNLRKQLCWLGPFERFLYVDADIVVFQSFAERMYRLQTEGFWCYSDQHLNGLAYVFKPAIVADGVLPETAVSSVFNTGFWGGRNDVFSEPQLVAALAACAKEKHYLDRSQGVSDQPVINHVVLKSGLSRVNLYRHGHDPGNWAGVSRFVQHGERLLDPNANNRPLLFLHWAGMRIEPDAPYWDVWRQARFADPSLNIPLNLPTYEKKRPLSRPARLFQRWSDRLLDKVWG
ncbi:MAG: hypothetical protein AAF614_20090, partial [Chloroflexota bacterium]